MDYVLGLFVFVTLAAGVVSAGVAVVALRRRQAPGAAALSAMMFAAAWWCFTYPGELLAPTLAGKLVWAQLEYLGIALVAPCWLLFALRSTGKISRATWAESLLFVIPVLTIAGAVAGPDVGLLWSDVSLKTVNGVTVFVATHAPLFWLNMAYSYACTLLGSIVLLVTVRSEVKVLTRQGLTLVLAVILPLLANAVTLFVTLPAFGLDLTPPCMVLAGALLAVSLSRYGALRIFPGAVHLARDIVVRGMRDGVLVLSREGVVLSANPAAERFLGVDAEGAAGRGIGELMDGLPADLLTDRGTDAAEESTFETVLGDGEQQRNVEVVVSPLASERSTSGLVLSMRDVTEQRRLMEELKHQALHDELTGLPNRSLLRAQLAELLKLARREHDSVALLMLDLDRFKEINDTFGHAAGDRVLQSAANRLGAALRESDVVARLGGDEFAVILPGSSGEDALRLAGALRQILAAPVSLGGRRLRAGASFGVAVAPDDGRDEVLLMQHADVALYRAKESTRGVARYEAAMDPNSPETLELLDQVRAAVERDQIVMHYQPIVACDDGAVVRMEALARWVRPDGRTMAGAEFVPLISRCGLLERLTELAVRHALDACRDWEADGWRTAVAVNLSAEDLRDVELPRRVAKALADHGMEPERLWLEITETSVMADPEQARILLEELRDIGVRLSIDDFGVGQSSLAYVRTLPAVDLKIDRSFTLEIGESDGSQAIIRATVALGHDLGLTVTGEGVEDDESFQTMRALGCDAVQGYGIARPMPAGAALAWARGRDAVPAR